MIGIELIRVPTLRIVSCITVCSSKCHCRQLVTHAKVDDKRSPGKRRLRLRYEFLIDEVDDKRGFPGASEVPGRGRS